MAAKIAEFLRSEPNMKYIRARILRQSKTDEYRIIGSEVADDHRTYAENPFAHVL
jgi:hypothetical protein